MGTFEWIKSQEIEQLIAHPVVEKSCREMLERHIERKKREMSIVISLNNISSNRSFNGKLLSRLLFRTFDARRLKNFSWQISRPLHKLIF